MVWGLELPEDHALVKSYVDMVDAAGREVSFVELCADLDPTLAESLFAGRQYLRLDNTRLSAADVAKQIAHALGLPSPAPGVQ